MELLKQRILRDGQVKEGGVLKVDSFLNHQMDVTLLNEIGREFRRRFDGAAITKIVTIEASGIGIAAIAAQHFGSVPVIFAKKTRSRNLDGALYTAKVHSFTKDITYDVQLSKKFLGPQDTVLILDDFLARGQALLGLIDIVRQAGAQCAGCCFSKRMRKVFRKNEKSMLQNCNKKAKRKGRLQRVKKPM